MKNNTITINKVEQNYRRFKDPVKTLDELSEAHDIALECITLQVVDEIKNNDTFVFHEVNAAIFEDEAENTYIKFYGSFYTKNGVTALVEFLPCGRDLENLRPRPQRHSRVGRSDNTSSGRRG